MPEQKDTLGEVLVHLQYIKAGVDGMQNHLQLLNGRTRDNELDIATLKERVPENPKRQGGIAGTIAGGVAGGIIMALQAWWNKP